MTTRYPLGNVQRTGGPAADMRVIFHSGAHCTSEERLLKCLLRNKDAFSRRGISIPGPGKYRKLIKNSCKALEHAQPAPDARDILLDAILDEERADRLILSQASFFSTANYALNEGCLYPLAGERVASLCRLFGSDQVELFMAIRNPATFLPSAFSQAPDKVIRTAMEATDLHSLRWSDTITRIREAAPEVPVTLWCYEDSPLIWSQIIREMAGLDHGERIIGGFDLLSTIMSREGMKRFRAYLHENRDLTEMQKRRVISAFLDKFALEDALEEELDLPGWTEHLVEELTELYDEDVFAIQRMPGVQVISP